MAPTTPTPERRPPPAGPRPAAPGRAAPGRAARWAAAALLALLPAPLPAPAAAGGLSERDRADVARIEAHLNSFRTMSASFTQVSSDGGVAEGRILLRRPGSLRLDYTRPPGVEIYVERGWLIHVDAPLEAVSYIPLERTPARFLVGERIGLSDGVAVGGVTRGEGSVSVALASTDGDGEGTGVTLTFAEGPLRLRRWTVVDLQGVTTRVTLSGLRLDVDIPDEVFEFDPRRFEPEHD